MVAISHTVARCARCAEPVTLLESSWHHAGPADHAVELDADAVVVLEAPRIEAGGAHAYNLLALLADRG